MFSITKSDFISIGAGLAAGVLSAVAFRFQASPATGSHGRPEAEPAALASGAAVRQPSLRRELLSRFRQYTSDRTRHHRVLLQEVISAYLRTDSTECLALLHSLKGMALFTDHNAANPTAVMELDDFPSVFRLAAETDGRTGDALIRSAFRRCIEADPEKAFRYLSMLPRHLREQLATELAKSWGAKDGAKAVDAFFRTDAVPYWQRQTMEAMIAWAGNAPEAAYQHLLGLDLAGSVRDELIGRFFQDLAKADTRTAVRLLGTQGDIPTGAMQSASDVFVQFSRQDAQAALDAAKVLSSAKTRRMALEGIAWQGWTQNPKAAIEAANQMPVSKESLEFISNVTGYLALTNKDPFGAVDQQTDPYAHQAAISGVSLGKVYENGLDGMSEIVRRGLAANDAGWLESAGDLVIAPELRLSVASKKPSPDWKSLPSDVAQALLDYATANWPAEKVAALQAKLK